MNKNNLKVKIGVISIVISTVAFLMLPLIPFLEISVELKGIIATVIFIIAEILFWVGGVLVGKELFVKYKSRLNPKNWFKKSSKTESNE